MRRRSSPIKGIVIVFIVLLAAGSGAFILLGDRNPMSGANNPQAAESPQAPETPEPLKVKTPEDLTREYFAAVNEKNYDGLYNILTPQSQVIFPRGDFTAKYKSIYEGIEAGNIELNIYYTEDAETQAVVHYSARMDTLAGPVSYRNSAVFEKDPYSGEYLMVWAPETIFSNLTWNNTVKVTASAAKRGQIFTKLIKEITAEELSSKKWRQIS